MSFWRGEKLAQVLPGLIVPFDKDRIDCASYKLSVGDQAFVTSENLESHAPDAPLLSLLRSPPFHTLRIRPGQFAFLVTEETVRVPSDALALISMRTTYKFKGLINVSGFHVDPGFDGKLIFAVYNAGPVEVIIERKQPLFLIVYGDLDGNSTYTYNGKSQGQTSIDSSLLQNMTEQVFSPQMLERRTRELAGALEAQKRWTDEKVRALSDSVDNDLADLEKTATSIATKVSIVTLTTISVVGLMLALLTYLATIAPGWFGVTLAKTLEASGYEIKQKPPEQKAPERSEVSQAAPAVATSSSAATPPLRPIPPTASSSTK